MSVLKVCNYMKDDRKKETKKLLTPGHSLSKPRVSRNE